MHLRTVVTTHCIVNADHAGNWMATQSQSHNLLLLCLQGTGNIVQQASEYGSNPTFGSKFVAMLMVEELVEALHCKFLQIFVPPIEGPSNVFCDTNKAVTKNTITNPELTLRMMEHNAIAYYWRREAVATGTVTMTKDDGKTNLLADILSKPLPQANRDFQCNHYIRRCKMFRFF